MLSKAKKEFLVEFKMLLDKYNFHIIDAYGDTFTRIEQKNEVPWADNIIIDSFMFDSLVNKNESNEENK